MFLALGALLPGYLAEYVSMRFAMQVVFLWSLLSFLTLVWSYVLSQSSTSEGARRFNWEFGLGDAPTIQDHRVAGMSPSGSTNVEIGKLRSR